MKSMIIVMAMTVVFGIGAAASISIQQDEELLLGDIAQPALTQETIDEFADSVETLLGVRLSEEQASELHGLLMRTWRLRDERGINMVMESVESWRPVRGLPPRERAELATRMRPEVIAHLRSGHGEITQWVLSVHEATAAQRGAATAAAAAAAAADREKFSPCSGT